MPTNESIIALKNVTVNEPIFTGHFQKHQSFLACSWLKRLHRRPGYSRFIREIDPSMMRYIYYLAGTDKTKFKRSVVPGDQVRLEVNIINL